MSIEPDTKDWTWVLRETCPECGLTAADVEPRAVADLVRGSVPRWQEVLGRTDVAVRPDASTWSGLEYACHVRDVFSLFTERLHLMLTATDARFANWDQDATALEQDYAGQEPRDVSEALASNGERLASSFDEVDGASWQRTGLRSDGSVFTVETFAQYFWHDVAHHLHDVDA